MCAAKGFDATAHAADIEKKMQTHDAYGDTE